MSERNTNVVDVVRTLVGPIAPVGETNEDARRFENLKELTTIIDFLLGDLERVASMKVRPEASISKAAKYADTFLNDVAAQR